MKEKMSRDEYLKMATKPEPEKFCAYCGKRMHRIRFESGRLEDMSAFLRRKYCDRKCMRKAFTKEGNTNQKYSQAHHTARSLAYSLLEKEPRCEKCGSTVSVDVHHIDGNYKNNSRENLMVLCRSCHMKEHRSRAICSICGAPAKGHGLCNKHLIRYRKYGNPLMCNNKIQEK